MKKKSLEPFRSCLLNSTANPAHFHQNLAGFSRPLLNDSQDFFLFYITIFILSKKIISQNTFARPFSRLISDGIGSVKKVLFDGLTD